MDEMKLRLSTKFMRNTVAKIISKTVFKKCGVKPDIILNEVSVELIDGRVHFYLDVDAEVDGKELLKLTKLVDDLD